MRETIKESNRTVDVVVVGSGAGGMSAAITAAASGLEVVIIEKSTMWGGSTARSGGGVWIPGNDALGLDPAAARDDVAAARTYLRSIIGDAVDPSLIDAYLDRGPEALRFLTAHSALDLEWVRGYSDYLPERPGGKGVGRSCEPRPFDARALGADLATLQPFYTRTPLNVVVQQSDYRWISTGMRTWRGPVRMAKVALRTALARMRRRKLIGLGGALAASLMVGVRDAGVPVLLDTPMTGLLTEGDTVVGVECGSGTQIAARRGVVLACGGFDHDEAMRTRWHRRPAGPALSLGALTNTGDGIRSAATIGAHLDLMDDAWWAPSIPLPKGPWFALAERSLPRSMMVNAAGRRFMNESLPYVEATHAMFGGRHGAGSGPAENLPAWLIFDQTYRDRYMFAGKPARTPLPQSWFGNGALTRAETVDALAVAVGIDPTALRATVDEFNRFARDGVDARFGRGRSAYDRYYADPSNSPNPSLGPIENGPFYAARIVPADLGTKGGVVTDTSGRALRADHTPIRGLYAVGNTSAAVMGHTYAGPGATIGPALVFGHLAGLDLAKTGVRRVVEPPVGTGE